MRTSPLPPSVRPIVFPILVSPVLKVRRFSLLLNIFQSVAERAPVVVELAVRRENTPERLLYERGQRAERAVSPILVATVVVRVEREPERVDTFVFVVARLPERDAIVVV